MKKLIALVFGVFWILTGCISDQENIQIILDREKKLINEYITQNPIPAVKELPDNGNGIRLFFTELSNSGKKVAVLDTVFVDYTGKLLNNRIFDTSIESIARENNLFQTNRTYEPLRFIMGYGMVIPGFEFAVLNMEEGDKAVVIMPSIYGYGNVETGNIPRNSPLIFELHLVTVNKAPVLD